MEEHAHEVLVVVESNAVRHPGTVMVHLEDALVALRAMMTPFGLGFEAPLTNSNTSGKFLSFY